MRRWKKGCLAVGASLVMGLGVVYWSARPASPVPWFDHAPRPLLLAHQGGECEWPSNTLEAFRQARRVGSDVLDMDVHLSSDGVLVLMHDTTVDRTTDGRGAIRDLSWQQLQKLDAGYRFSQDGRTFPYRGKGLRIPRLEDILRAFPDMRLGIEMKQAPLEAAGHLARLLKQSGAESRVLLSCFDGQMMGAMRQLCPTVATSATPWEVRGFVLASTLHLEDLVSPRYCALQIPLEHSGLTLVSPRTVEAAHRRGVKVIPWTIDTLAEAEICRQAGCDGLNTNWPGRMEPLRSGW
ncbi:glycerophosphodiester phosphodiesterase [bacterium]|nr:glycerophosphodiester phosphodiesterase [bacterium]